MTEHTPNHPPKVPVDQALRAHAPKPLVRRLRPIAVGIMLATIIAIVAGRIVLKDISTGTPPESETKAQPQPYRPTDAMIERGLLGMLPRDYTFLPTPAEPPVVKESSPEHQVGVAPEPPDPLERRRLEQLQREYLEAVDSPIRFDVALDSSVASARPYTARLDKRTANQGSDTRAPSRPASPMSPFAVQAGTIIPAALVTAINSDLPGDIIGQVTAHVYDSTTGEHLLIPQGTRLVGQYDSEIRNGQDRVLIAWQRLILPNGESLILNAMPATDAGGVAGLGGRVDHHFGRLAAATLLSTFVALGGNLAVSQQGDNETRDIVGSTVAQQASRLSQRLIERELNLQPTIHIDAGTTFNVLVNRDLQMRPYKSVRNRPATLFREMRRYP